MKSETLRRVCRALETGGFSLVLEQGVIRNSERTPPNTRLGRFAEVLATGGYSLLDRHVQIEAPTQQQLVTEEQTTQLEE